MNENDAKRLRLEFLLGEMDGMASGGRPLRLVMFEDGPTGGVAPNGVAFRGAGGHDPLPEDFRGRLIGDVFDLVRERLSGLLAGIADGPSVPETDAMNV